MDIKTKGKGAIREKFKLKNLLRKRLDVHWKYILLGATDLNTYDLCQMTPIKDQGASSSCGGQAFSKYLEALKIIRDTTPIQLSAKDLYSHVYLKGGGSSEGDLVFRLENNGIAFESDVSSYQQGNPPTEQYMETIQPLNDQQETDALNQLIINSYTFNGNDINQVKMAINTGYGCCVALEGNNACWQGSNGVVEVPGPSQLDWGHWLYLIDYDDQKQLVRACNSWGTEAGDKGYYYIPYGYFSQNRVYGEYILTLAPQGYEISLLEKIINIYKNIIDLLTKK